MWKPFSEVVRAYPRISMEEERRLIAEAQKGSKKSREELVLRYVNFLNHRIRRIAFPRMRQQFGDDLLEEGILIIYQKIKSYNLRYRDGRGNLKPVKFSSYIWKRIDGFILDFLKKELGGSRFHAYQKSSKTEHVRH